MERYEIRVAGLLSDRRMRTFQAADAHRNPDGTTTLVVVVPDQAALHAVVSRVGDLGLELLEVRRAPTAAPDGIGRS